MTQFKNYANLNLALHDKFNLIVGPNGAGKTNLLDAIYYTCFCKSNFHKQDRYIPTDQKEYFRIESTVRKDYESLQIVFKVEPGKKKELLVDGKVVDKLTDHIGRVPCIMIIPDDVHNLLSGSAERRRLMDICICQYDSHYLSHLITYNRILKQRNAYLKDDWKNDKIDQNLLLAFDWQMIEPADYIYRQRKTFIEQVRLEFEKISNELTGQQEELDLLYVSQLNDLPVNELLILSRKSDMHSQRTNTGIHKDDLEFNIDDRPLKVFGSQGQLKSFVLSLKLAQFQMLKMQSTTVPILILDDICDKLDQQRVFQLLSYLKNRHAGQVFISDTHPDRVSDMIRTFNGSFVRYFIKENRVVED